MKGGKKDLPDVISCWQQNPVPVREKGGRRITTTTTAQSTIGTAQSCIGTSFTGTCQELCVAPNRDLWTISFSAKCVVFPLASETIAMILWITKEIIWAASYLVNFQISLVHFQEQQDKMVAIAVSLAQPVVLW